MYIVIEIQKNTDTPAAVLTYVFDTYNEAMQKFYLICSAAVVSEINAHTVFVMTTDGDIYQQQTFNH